MRILHRNKLNINEYEACETVKAKIAKYL